jgi:hypothetical protein
MGGLGLGLKILPS